MFFFQIIFYIMLFFKQNNRFHIHIGKDSSLALFEYFDDFICGELFATAGGNDSAFGNGADSCFVQ